MPNNVRKVISQIRNAGTALLQGEVVRASGNSTAIRAQADTELGVTGVLGVTASAASAGAGLELATKGEALVRLEPALTPVAGQALYVSESIAGRLTNVAPALALPVGILKDTSNYASQGTSVAIINVCCLAGEVIGSLLSFSDVTNQIEFGFTDPGVETILASAFGPYFHALVDFDSIPGTQIRLHVAQTANPPPEDFTFRVRIGPAVQNQPDAISGTVRLEFENNGAGVMTSSDYFPKPVGRQMVTFTLSSVSGAAITFTNPKLFIESDILGTRAILLMGQTPVVPASNNPDNWTVDLDWLQSDNMLVSMSGLTKTNAAAVAANMILRQGTVYFSQAGTDMLTYSILSQVPIDEYMPTGVTSTIANPGGVHLLRWAVTGHAQTQAQFKSVLLVGVD